MDSVKDSKFKRAMKDEEESCIKVELKSDSTRLGHQELVKLTKTTIDSLVEHEPLLSGLPSDVTIEELKSQIAVAQGQAITLFLNRGELPKLAVVVPPHNTTVLDLKKAIKRHTNLSLKRENVKKKTSWKHIWKKYHLCFGDIRLSNDNENIKAYGIANKVELHFIKRRREKNKLIKN
ncbi:PREDICTED: U11/U12 small nuclear ribonucleoprotein 25 kDa protein [Trachymyrmex cornetzi]|uniref:U11/U12 small nuclear ribonucleoprotein 25 kDa protein n=1 Tax=Trachymyrmex cornetzi TaxID=471704 RepID=A0A195DGB6_9HYME|nr:PREDICTED: U11/U12 small nuclear ribonucleoprotein 25 kDa protein [Trachymyrmex cornetzi]XP_018373479.1 PREDICTED: U11/U12 small nuclear ribonucleoprotein 25 kDa protein [Trachymyrmex cornetzi]XP_018373480.1 PREDICTED: U11/U12 small nuclear ribonucleoprotein 25 kDa protein [Trachymyrmex cornetzi]KYN11886.1 U11/U12 small nuclear ribonucleoprotein 25 kDa protein [Trachymyrmex cornetzi]